MTAEERIELALQRREIPTYEDWYELNKLAFTLVKNSKTPEETYNEYIREVLGI